MPIVRLATALVLVYMVIMGCVSHSNEEAALRLRVSEYEKNWTSRRYDNVWKMMSQSLRDSDKTEERQFVEFVQRSQASLIKIDLEDIRIVDAKATVLARVTIQSTTGPETKQETQQQQWIKVDGKWFLDGYRSVP